MVPNRCQPQVEDAMTACGALAVTLQDRDDSADSIIYEPAPGETPVWESLEITGLFPEQSDPLLIEAVLRRDLDIDPRLRWEILQDQPWERAWLKDFQPLVFGNRLCICPQHLTPPAGLTAVLLDPGLAFGTGTHPTTGLCLEYLCRHDLANSTVLDFGCGSGILGIAALKLGARRVIAVDNDPQALTATLENARRNQVSDQVQVMAPEDTTNPDMTKLTADFIVANILAGTLIELSGLIGPLALDASGLALSGILRDQADTVASHYAEYVSSIHVETRDDWVLLQGTGKGQN